MHPCASVVDNSFICCVSVILVALVYYAGCFARLVALLLLPQAAKHGGSEGAVHGGLVATLASGLAIEPVDHVFIDAEGSAAASWGGRILPCAGNGG